MRTLRMRDMAILSGVAEDGADAFDELIEALFGLLELFSAPGGELVVLGVAVGLSERPFGVDPAVLFHAVQSGVERALFDAEQIVGGALDVLDDAVAVKGAVVGESLEDEEVEGSLEVGFRQLSPLAILVPRTLGLEN